MVRDPDHTLSGGVVARRDRLSRYWFAALPAPPQRLRRGPWRDGAFPSGRRSTGLTSRLGVLLGIAFGICLLTGLFSHLLQHQPGWLGLPARPARLYQLTQGVHVATGLASVPLLGAKLWAVYPRLFAWPPARTVAHAAERVGVGVLVAAALFQLLSGILNIAHWYAPMPFFFTTGHYWVGWMVAGALLVHLGVQLPVARAALARRPDARGAEARPADAPHGDARPADAPHGDARPADAPQDDARSSRRELLLASGAAAGLITLLTVGQTIRLLTPVALLAPRRPGTGPQGVPVNRTAAAAAVLPLVRDPAYRLVVAGPAGEQSLDLAALAALAQHTAVLPIACVEGWSSTATWTGVRLRDLVALAGADPARASVEVESLQATGRYRTSTVQPPHTGSPLTLLALRLGGEPLHVDHGYPVRLIAPDRPGVLQTKWVGRITVREEA